MEGLEISEVLYQDLDSYGRIDAELYNKNYTRFKTALGKIPYTTFEKESEIIKKGIFDIKSSSYCSSGIPFVRISNIRNMTIDTSDIAFIPLEEHRKNYKTELKRGDIILSKTANAAASVVNLERCNVSQDTVAIKLKSGSKVLSYYVVVFLNTKYGLEQLQRRFTGNIQMHLNLEECKKEVLIPVFSEQFQKQIQELFEKSIFYSSQSKTLYSEAEEILLSELGIKDWQPNNAQVSIKNLKDSFLASGRLDAEYYQTKYDELFSRLSKFECDTISHIAIFTKSVEPGSDAYQESGIPFLRVSDVSKFGISEPKIYLSPEDFDLEELRPKKDMILLSKDGSVGIAYKVEEDMDCITSSALLHLWVFNKDYNPDYLTLVLNSIVVGMQAERDSNGAIIQHWKPSEIEQVIIPKLPMSIQETISAKIQESFALRAESKRLLEEAKLMVENEIEKGGD
ncbi:MAG: hypothetical protein MJZ99_11060 [Bacteroidales bacterium]|nr:hypothetical protein [Bacteroidales bacterium]